MLADEVAVEVCEADRLSGDRLPDDLLQVPARPGRRQMNLPALFHTGSYLLGDAGTHSGTLGEVRVAVQGREKPKRGNLLYAFYFMFTIML